MRRWHACLLLACSAVGSLAGVLAPTLWVNWTGWPWPVVTICLMVALLGSVILAGLTGQLASGLLLLVGAVGVSVPLLMLTWFVVGPSTLVGLWLLGAGLLSWPERRSRAAVVRSGVLVLVVGLGQLSTWWLVPDAPEVAAVALNVLIVCFLVWQALRSAPALKGQLAAT
ncbi:hypothetical protein [Citricoccus alkalitolerans]|uniref:Uncharacterized protein n=1 Tax=Citricoccus alkalitolerans TaxID=246603 RepID=A0ABV8Y2A9_9MICC